MSTSSLGSTEFGQDALPSPSGRFAQQQPVYTRFHWPRELGGEEVFVWGSWNGWAKGWPLQRQSPDQDMCVVVPMKPGNYEFKYVVDKTWTAAPHEPTALGKEGTLNNFRVVAPTMSFKLNAPQAQQVLVVGEWDDWQYSLVLRKDHSTGCFTGQAHLEPGLYSFQYCVDGVFLPGQDHKVERHPDRFWCHRDWSQTADIFRIFYQTGWEETVLHYRRLSRSGQPTKKEFTRMTMVGATARANAMGLWKMGTVVPETSEGEGLEFYLSNGLTGERLKEDRPPASSMSGSSGLYKLSRTGSFKLARGQIRPFPRAAEQRFMLVSDIDGTMIGDPSIPEQGCASSLRFLNYWENGPALAGCVLVYNTGRSLGQFVDLMKKCEKLVAVPEVIVTAVGTKIWHLDESCGRCNASGLNWVEDKVWSRQLDAGWNLALVKAAARKLVDHYKNEEVCSILDNGSEHEHRIALNCAEGVLQHVTGEMAHACRSHGIDARVIVSGHGTHRYVDCVPVAAGKEKALQYVRKRYAIPEHMCVAAGDSGNDVLMLEGDHPGIVVGNAQPELVHWLTSQPQTGKLVMTEATLADGIIEGLARLGLY